jgi:hypothetical protein
MIPEIILVQFRKEVLSLLCLTSIIFSIFLLIKRDHEKELMEIEIKNLTFENKVLMSTFESEKPN